MDIRNVVARIRNVEEREAFRATLRALPGYPWLPCPICKGNGSCDHIAAERAQAAIPGLVFSPNSTN